MISRIPKENYEKMGMIEGEVRSGLREKIHGKFGETIIFGVAEYTGG